MALFAYIHTYIHTYIHDLTFSCFGALPACDRRTDGRTHDNNIYRVYSVARLKWRQIPSPQSDIAPRTQFLNWVLGAMSQFLLKMYSDGSMSPVHNLTHSTLEFFLGLYLCEVEEKICRWRRTWFLFLIPARWASESYPRRTVGSFVPSIWLVSPHETMSVVAGAEAQRWWMAEWCRHSSTCVRHTRRAAQAALLITGDMTPGTDLPP